MCCGVYYTLNDEEKRVSFSDPDAVLPAIIRTGKTRLLGWGRRSGQTGRLPLGGWARLDSIRAGYWNRWFPIAVKVPARGFTCKDTKGQTCWYELTCGQWIQGLVARYQHEHHIYIVTLPPARADAIHECWPRILSG